MLDDDDDDDDDDDYEDLEDDEDMNQFEDDVRTRILSEIYYDSTEHTVQDSESEADLPARRRAAPKGRGGGASSANVNPEECKQQ